MIICAAVRTANGKIYAGHRHCDAIRSAVGHGEPTPITQKMQGFLTNDRVFVDRKDAAQIAFICGQITEPKETLFSEDVW
jgi:hypothetical protein